MMTGFECIALYLAMSVIAVLGMYIISVMLGPLRPKPNKQTPYECGVPLLDPSTKRYDVKYYVVGVLFLVFDLETVLIYPLASRFKEFAHYGWGAFFEVFIFVAILVAGLVYAIARGAIEWD